MRDLLDAVLRMTKTLFFPKKFHMKLFNLINYLSIKEFFFSNIVSNSKKYISKYANTINYD